MVYFPQYRFEIYRKNSSGTINPVPELLNGFSSIDYAGGIETTKDVLTVKFSNYRSSSGSWVKTLGKQLRVDNFVGIDDEIKFYAYYGSALPAKIDDALIIAGRIAGFDYKPEGEGFTYTVKIVNRTEELLNTMIPYSSRAATGVANTPSSAIKQMVARLNKYNPSKNLFAYYTNEINPYTGSYGHVAAFKSDGGSFPTIDYNETWKPVYYNIEKLSTTNYTEDEAAGEYIFYVKYTPVLPIHYSKFGSVINELVWSPKPLVNSGTLVDGSQLYNVNINLDLREVQNLLIVNAGTDRKGAGITTVAYNAESMGKYGVKTGYYTTSRRVFSEIHQKESAYAQNVLGATIDSDGMPASGYPLTMSFVERDDYTGSFTGVPLSAGNKTAWNQYLRDEAKWQAKLNAQKTLEKLGEPRYALNADMVVGSNTIVAGDLYTFVSPSYGWDGTEANPGYKLRVKDIQHTFSDTGWTSRIEVLEDEQVISEYLGNRKSNINNG